MFLWPQTHVTRFNRHLKYRAHRTYRPLALNTRATLSKQTPKPLTLLMKYKDLRIGEAVDSSFISVFEYLRPWCCFKCLMLPLLQYSRDSCFRNCNILGNILMGKALRTKLHNLHSLHSCRRLSSPSGVLMSRHGPHGGKVRKWGELK